MFNPGDLKEKITVLGLIREGNRYWWKESFGIWAKAEEQNRNNLFSKVGLGAKSIHFSIRKKPDITLHHALRWKGKHCFITSVTEVRTGFLEVEAAVVEPKECTVRKEAEPVRDEWNRPVYGEPVLVTFPGCLIEKYAGYIQGEPMATSEMRYVIVTPKGIRLHVGDLVTIEEKTYQVLTCHILDEYKNEYEVMCVEDV